MHSDCLTWSFRSLATSKGCEVSDNDIHALKSICGHRADKGSAPFWGGGGGGGGGGGKTPTSPSPLYEFLEILSVTPRSS